MLQENQDLSLRDDSLSSNFHLAQRSILPKNIFYLRKNDRISRGYAVFYSIRKLYLKKKKGEEKKINPHVESKQSLSHMKREFDNKNC